jgi:CTP synthase
VARDLEPLSGIIVPGGFGRRGLEGKVACIAHAREKGLPFLGICYGFQAAMIEYARSHCGLARANTTENDPETSHPVICLLPEQYKVEGIGGTMRLGKRRIELLSGSLASRLYGADEGFERFRHRYEFNPEFRELLEEKGMVFSGWAPGQPIMQIAELPSHPFYVGVQFHPEFRSRPVSPSPIFQGFVNACVDHKARALTLEKRTT